MNGPGQASGTRAVLLTVVIVVAVLRLAQEVFIPLALAILFTFLLAPLVGRLASWGVNRLLAVIVSVAIALSGRDESVEASRAACASIPPGSTSSP